MTLALEGMRMTVIDIVNPATGEKLGAVPEKTK